MAGKRWELARVYQTILAGKNRFHFKWREKVGTFHACARKSWRERIGFSLTLIGMTKDEKGLAFFKGLLL
jgi:hypothetical protein